MPDRPAALAAGDLDEDGVPDLIVGYGASGGRGFIEIHPGDAAAIYPNDPGVRGRRASAGSIGGAFLSRRTRVEVPAAPDYLVTGDFDADDHVDVLVATEGGPAFHLLPGKGDCGFRPAEEMPLPGGVTALLAGDLNRPDGAPDLVAAVDGAGGPRLVFFAAAEGASLRESMTLSLPMAVTSLAAGRFDDDILVDVAVAVGSELWLVRGDERGGPTASSLREGRGAHAARIGAFPGSSIRSLVAGDFDDGGPTDLAVLLQGGSLLLRYGPVPDGDDVPATFSDLFASAAGPAPADAILIPARISGRGGDDLVVLDPAGRGVRFLAPHDQTSVARTGGVAGGRRTVPQEIPLPWATIAVEGEPVTALAMRLNGDAADDLVVLQQGVAGLYGVLTSPLATFGVSNLNDNGPGSLRQAILDANATSGADTITFSIGGAGPYVIRPTSALPAAIFPVTVDGTTQPGFAGTPIIQIDGSLSGNGVTGLVISGGTSTVRGLVVNRFGGTGAGDGVRLQTAGGNIVEGNYIGTDVTGATALANTGAGLVVDNIGSNTIGGTVAAGRNVASGNVSVGILIRGSAASSNVLQNNFVGTRATGTATLPNGGSGIVVDGSPSNQIGLSNTLPNLISGNGGAGLLINGGATGNLIRGNVIGTDLNKTMALRNTLDGIRILSGSTNTLGGTTVGLRNAVAFNGGSGVAILGGTGNRLMRNQIFSNVALGIDLGGDGVTANDAADPDAGANGTQNYPVLVSAVTDAVGSTITGSFNSRPSTSYTVEFFSSPDCDPSGFGEGKLYFSSTTVTTDAGGNAPINLAGFPIPVRTFLTATASDPGGNTSEFSNCVRVSDQTPQEVSGFLWSGPTTLNWDAIAGATSYNVFRGRNSFLPNLPNTAMESCLRQTATTTTTGPVLGETPPLDTFYWYLVAGVNGFGQGTVGDGNPGARILDSFGNCPTCAHEKCEVGGPLASGCDPCVTSICASMPSCCTTQWTSACLDRVLTVCGSLECAASKGACPHQQCVSGSALPAGCDSPPVSPSCVSNVCAFDPVCCSTTWDATCIDEVGTECSRTCS